MLNSLRKKIDIIDSRMVALLNQRARLSLAIGKEKIKNSKGIYSPHREKQVLQRIRDLNKGPMSYEDFESIYREIMSSSLALEKSLRIAYLGTEGSHTHLAANKKFGSRVTYIPCESIPEVFQKVEYGDCDYGVVPIENSIEGAVTTTFDLLVDSELKACAQILMKISHNLLSRTRDIRDIRRIYSNPQVFGQCRNWLLENAPRAGHIGVASTTEAARRAKKEKGAAAIASSLAAKIYGIPTVRTNIQDIAHNTTRFLVLATHDVPPTGRDRTTILFSIKDKVGALHAMLTPFVKNKINLTKIESRPAKKKAWDYYFFVDFEGHRMDKNVQKALGQLEGMCKYLKVIGSYPVMD
ncbi:MAG: prephenate dehydratase [Candidatus Omnitrophica bacterium]|nr:prephenate dehydratase [Candidatus Omnitrophota bacterium]